MATITGSNGSNIIVGTSGGDVINANGGNDIVLGGKGNDTIDGGSGNDALSGGNGNDTILGGSGSDLISGDSGNDTLDGGAGSDIVLGGSGNDTLIHRVSENGTSYDLYDGGNGQDTLRLVVSAAVYSSAAFQADLAQLQAKLAQGSASDYLESINLLVTSIERLEVVVEGNANQAPTDIALSGNTVAENVAGAAIGTLSTVDPNAGDSHTYTVSDSRFEVVGNTLKLKAGESLDFEAGSSINVNVTSKDGGNLSFTEQFTINVTDINEAPTLSLANPTTAINENVVVGDGIKVADIVVTDDALGAESLSLTGTDAGSFTIIGNALYFTGSSPNFEAKSSYDVTVNVNDEALGAAGSIESSQNFTLTINNVNEAPVDIALAGNTVAENAPGATIGTLSTVDPDTSDTHTYIVSDARFEVVGNTLKLRDDASLDHETASSVSVTVTANDGGLTHDEAFTISVTNANDAPTDISLSATAVNENAKGATIGILTATDQDVGDTHTFSIADSNSAFEVVDNVLKLKDEVALDFEEAEQLSVTITVTDAAGASFDREFVITVNDATIEGVSVDGYIAGAEVFADANENGVRDSGENWTTTDAFGNFSFFGPVAGPLVLSGGTDISTGQAFTGIMRAPAGSTVVTPLTTLVMAIVDLDPDNVDVATAQAQVLAGLGLDPTLDLANFDPIDAALSSEPGVQAQGSAAIAAAVQIQNTIVQAASLLDGADAGLSLEAAAAAVVTQLATVLTAGALDLNTASSLQSIIEGAAETVGLTDEVAGDLAEGAAAVISSTNAVVEQALQNNQTGVTLLTTLAEVSSVAQGEASADLALVGSGETPVEDLASYADLTDELANAQVGNVTGAVGDGDDVLFGTDNADTLEGFGGNDTVNGLGGHDILIGGAGNDLLAGGAGRDRANYTAATGAIDVDLAAGTVTGDASVGIDTLREVEIVRGTDFADTFDADGFGQAGALNVGSDGTFNQFEGRGGDDIIIGNGNTGISYRSATGAVAVDLAAGTAIGDVSVGNDDIQGGVSNVSGSAYNDDLRGNGGSNTFVGNAGDDFINGRGGNDRAVYSNVIGDTVTGGVTINMAAGTVTGDASVGSDTLRSIEFIRGSKFDDTYDATGFGLAGALNIGNSGTFNEIEGMGGNDTIIANGNTRIAFYNATSGVTVDLAAGTATGDSSVGTDTITGGVIQVAGSQFDDSLSGSDTLGQTAQNFEGRAGDDLIDGRGGFDRALYGNDSAVEAGISVDLASGIVTGDAAVGTDTLRSVEGVRGTDFADTFDATGFGTLSANAGGSDFNEFEGLGGNDTITGNGNTRISYNSATGGVVVNFSAGTVTGDSSVGTDTFTDVFSVQGSSGDDTYVYASGDGGYAVVNFVAGAGGIDRIDLSGVPGMGDLSAVLNVAFQQGLHTVLDFGNGDILTLNNVTLGTLVAGDFVFAPNQAPSVSLANVISSLPENTSTATATKVAEIVVSDDGFGTNSLSLTGAQAASFEIVGTDLYLRAGVVLDFEGLSSLQVTVQVDDASVGATPDATANFTLTVTDVNDVAPTITSGATASEAENTAIANVVYQVTATDPDTVGTVTYSLSGVDGSLFDIDSVTGAVTFIASPNFEAPADANGDNVYDIVVHANDGIHDTTKNVAISVTDVNDVAPTFTSGATASEAENTIPANVVYQATATDPDTVGTVTYSLSGDDASLFDIDGVTGAVTFIASPDFEVPADLDDNNVYDIVVHANDGIQDTTKNVAITVTNVSGNFVGDNDVNNIVGTTEEDTIQALGANDTLQGLAGDDTLDGGAGSDRAVYSDAAGGIAVDMAAGTVSGAGVGSDTLIAIEQVTGSNHADTYNATGYIGADLAPGTSVRLNEFQGLAGDDTITGNGSTRISYVSATGGVTVDFAAGSATGDASVGTDTFTGVRTVRGSNFADTIFGSDFAAAPEVFEGRGGDDFIDGRGGGDRVQYNFDATGAGIRVNMANGIVVGDAAIGTDTLRSVENIRGTDFADVYVASGFGTSGANVGDNGTSNEFEGEGGNDFITGNNSTRISYLHALDAVTVDIATGTGSGTAAGDIAGVGFDSFTGVNAVRGSTFNDTLLGSNNGSGTSELFEGFQGDDFINGRGGFDVARYDNLVDAITGPNGITVNMAAGTVTGIDAAATAIFGTDTLRSVESIRGSDVNDVYVATGFSNASTNAGSSGSGGTLNEFEGNAGNDTITGNGNTRISYSSALAGVTVNLAIGQAFGTAAGDVAGVGNDTIISGVNAVRGSGFGDLFRGTGASETFEGQGGNDRILYDNATGGITVSIVSGAMTVTGVDVGTDTLQSVEFVTGSAHNDSYNVATFAGFNEFQGGGGDDTITGSGNTRVSYLDASAGVTVNLTAPGVGTAAATSGDAGIGTDTFTGGVTSIRGSNFNDVLNGSNNANLTSELFEGRGGDDLIDGRNGFDIAVYDIDPATTAGISVAVSSTSTLLWTVTGDATVGTDTLTAVESIRGTDFADTFNAAGFNGASTVGGFNIGADFNEFEGNGGNDIITGNGNTRIIYLNATGGVTVDLAAGTATGDASVGSDTITGGVNRVRGSTFNDTIGGTGGSETLDGREGVDTMSYLAAGAGVTVSLGLTTAQNTIGAGTDTLSNFESLIGSNFDDTLTGNAGVNVLTGAGGDDIIDGGGDRDIAVLSGNFADYTVTGFTSVVDNVAGRDGSDTLNGIAILEFADRYVLNQDTSLSALALNGLGFAPDKSFYGTAGDDTIITGTNSNLRLFDLGDGASDAITLNGAGTYLANFLNVEFTIGTAGNENVYLQNVASGLVVNLLGGTDALTLANGANSVTIGGIENVTGGTGDDQITVAGASSVTSTITGGLGADVLTGSGDNIETFRYGSVADSSGASTDTITNFTEGQDKFDFSAIDANTETGGDNAFVFGGENANVLANSVTWFQDGGNTIVQADTNGDAAADMTITLTGLKTLSSTDFLL